MTASISTKTVSNSSKRSVDLPRIFFKGFLMLLTSLSQNPPHHGAFSTIKFHVICLFARYRQTSSARVIFRISWDEDLNVLALSEVMVAGNPLRLVNFRKASKNDSTLSPCVSSKCTARVEAHVKRQTDLLWFFTFFLWIFRFDVQRSSEVELYMRKGRILWHLITRQVVRR